MIAQPLRTMTTKANGTGPSIQLPSTVAIGFTGHRALGEPRELKDWGIAVRDVTRMMALERHRKFTKGVLVEEKRSAPRLK